MSHGLKRIYAHMYRHLMYLKRPFEVFNYAYWIALDIILFGFLGRALSNSSTGSAEVTLILINLCVWFTFVRGSALIGVSMLRDLWDYNFVNIMSTPLKIREWATAQCLLGTISGLLSSTFGFIFVHLLFKVPLTYSFPHLLLALIVLLPALWTMGLFMMSLILLIGQQVSMLLWAIAWLIVPISGVYYQTSVLPKGLQIIASYNPIKYVFAYVRTLFIQGIVDYSMLFMALKLLVPYALGVVIFFIFSYRMSKKRGLTRLELEP